MGKDTVYARYIKRVLDFLLASLALVVLSPLMLILSVLVRFKLGSPILFVQERPGYKGKIFKMYKFRSMTDKKDSSGCLLPDSHRITKFGKILRASSLDELPELWNIVRGDMAIVGPRPLLVDYLELYSTEQMTRHDVRPGLTGYAQVNGRNMISWPERFKLDVKYVNHMSLKLDWIIILQTIKKVLVKEGISSGTTVTMERFTGNKEK